MAKIIGILDTSFKTKDGVQIEGKTFFATEPIDPKRGEGLSAERFFLSKNKLETLDFTPAVGQDVDVFFNRFGKVSTLKLLSDTASDSIDFGK